MSKSEPAEIDKSQTVTIYPPGEHHQNKGELLIHSLPGMVPEGNQVKLRNIWIMRKPIFIDIY